MNDQNFDQWAIVEVFGHEKYAGHVSSTTIAGQAMLLLEVPEVQNMSVTLPAFTKYISISSVFSITPVAEDYARAMAAKLSKHPVEGYDHQLVIKQLARKATEEMTMAEIKKMINSNSLVAAGDTEKDPDELEF